jgi:hypothetical protein
MTSVLVATTIISTDQLRATLLGATANSILSLTLLVLSI